MQKWEYLIVDTNQSMLAICDELKIRYTPNLTDVLDKLGVNGWELVTNTGSSGLKLIFKRPLAE